MVYTVLSALFLFFAVGLGVDISHLYLAKTELQNTADAAALAGASALTLPNPDRIQTAVDRALNVMNLNRYNFDNRDYVNVMDLASQRALIEFAVNVDGPYMSEAAATANPENIRFVRATTPTVPINIFFSVPILGGQKPLNAKAIAGLSVPGNVNFCIVPLTAVQCDPGNPACFLCDKENDPDCSDSTFWGNCPDADPADPYAPQPIQTGEPDPDGDGFCDPKREFCKRCKYTIRSAPSDGPSAGNYNALACAGRGGCLLRLALAAAGDCQCTASPGEELEVDTEPGINAGPVRQGLNVRFDDFTCDPVTDPTCVGCVTDPTNHPPDSNIHQGTKVGKDWTGIDWSQYQAGSPFLAPSNPGVPNRRVLILPITPESEFYDDKDGREKVKVASFGGFFMTRAVGKGNDGNVGVEYIGQDIVSVIGFDPNGGPAANIVTPVLYR